MNIMNTLNVILKDSESGEILKVFDLEGDNYFLRADVYTTGVEGVNLSHVISKDADLSQEQGLILKIYEYYMNQIKQGKPDMTMEIQLNNILTLYSSTYIRKMIYFVTTPGNIEKELNDANAWEKIKKHMEKMKGQFDNCGELLIDKISDTIRHQKNAGDVKLFS